MISKHLQQTLPLIQQYITIVTMVTLHTKMGNTSIMEAEAATITHNGYI